MASTADQIQGDIAATRARMAARLDAMRPAQEGGTGGGVVSSVTSTLSPSGLSGITTTITQQVRKRPLAALGISLLAGSLIQSRISGGGGGSATSSVTNGVSSATDTVSSTLSQAGGGATQAASSATDTVTSAAQTAGQTVTGAAQSAGQTVAGAASSATSAAQDAASTVASTATDVAGSVASTASNVASQAATTASDAASTVAQTTTSVASRARQFLSTTASRVSYTVRNLGTVTTQQVQQRPLAALGVAMGAGALAQPAAAPQVSKLTQAVRQQATTVGGAVSSAASLPVPPEAERISGALVPAVVQRAQQFTSRDLREYLDTSLESIVSQATLRGGIVSAVVERAEGLTQNRLPSVLERVFTGTRGFLVSALAAIFLKARNESQQGRGPMTTVLKTDAVQGLTQLATDYLQRFLPEFRERYQSSQQ